MTSFSMHLTSKLRKTSSSTMPLEPMCRVLQGAQVRKKPREWPWLEHPELEDIPAFHQKLLIIITMQTPPVNFPSTF